MLDRDIPIFRYHSAKCSEPRLICFRAFNIWQIPCMSAMQHASNGKFNGKSMTEYFYGIKEN